MFNFAYQQNRTAQAIPITKALFDRAIDDLRVALVCRRIAEQLLGLASPDEMLRKQAQEKISELKGTLPAFCWHATFKENRRNARNAIPSGLVMLDVDHIDDPQKCFERLKEQAIKLNLVAAHVTPSTKGLRLVFIIPQGLSIPNAQSHLVQQLNIESDPCVKDLSRISYIVPRPYWLYINYDALFSDTFTPTPTQPSQPPVETERAPSNTPPQKISCSDRYDTPNTTVNGQTADVPSGSPSGSPEGSPEGSQKGSKSYPTTYQGIPYSLIVQNLEALYGGKPEHGNRNTQIFSMACMLRHICNDDPKWIAQILPTYGELETKWMSSIRSACSRNQTSTMPHLLTQAIEMSKMQCTKRESVAQSLDENAPPQMPEKLPKLIRLLVKNVPEVCRPSVANGVFPPLATHLSDVKFRLIDGTMKEATFMCVNMARQSSGKASINKPIEYIMADIKERDDINRRREQEWKDAMNTKGSNKEKPKRPDDLCVQMLVSDMTNAAFVQRAKDAMPKYIYTNLEELDMMRQLQTNGSKDIGKIICLCFDNGIYGQERVGNQSVTALLPLRWNWNASSTIEKGMDFFRNRLIDGTLSRINFCTIINDDSKEFKYGDYDSKYAEELKPYITNLNLCKGEVVCEKALAMARRLQQKCTEIALQSEDVIYQEFAYRAVTIAYMKAIVLYIANDMTWDKSIEEFCEWSLEYDLWVKNYFFGAAIHEARCLSLGHKRPGRVNMLNRLRNKFSFPDAVEMRKAAGKDPEGTKHMLSVWLNREFITYDEETQLYEKTNNFKNKN